MTAALPVHPYVIVRERCGICGFGFCTGEIPYRGLCSDEPFHWPCVVEHYAAIEYEPDECVQSRHRREP